MKLSGRASQKAIILSIGAGFLAIIFLSPGQLEAQGNTWVGTSLNQLVESARWRLGALRLNAALEIANAGYDSDIFFGYLTDPIPDLTVSAGAPVQALLPLGKKIVVDLFDRPQYLFYLNNSSERAWNNEFNGNIHLVLKRVYFQTGVGLSNIRQRLSPELNINVRRKENSLGGTMLWQVGRATSLAVLFNAARFEYSDAEAGGWSLSEILNRDEAYLDLIAYVQPSSRFRFFADAQYGTFTFLESTSSSRDARSYGFLGGMSFVPREEEERSLEPAQGSVSFGYKYFNILLPSYSDGKGIVGTADISVGLFKRTAGRLFFARDYTYSIFSDGSFYLDTAFGGGLSRRLSRRAALAYIFTFNLGTYPENESSPGPTREDFKYTNHSVSLGIQLSRYLRITIFGSLGQRTFGETVTANRRYFIGANLIYGSPAGTFSAPIRALAR